VRGGGGADGIDCSGGGSGRHQLTGCRTVPLISIDRGSVDRPHRASHQDAAAATVPDEDAGLQRVVHPEHW